MVAGVSASAASSPLIVTASGQRMVVTGTIDTAAEMIAQFDALAATGDVEVMFMNCNGGNVLEGMAFYNHVKAAKVKKTAIVRGFTASMGAYLLLAFDAVYVEPFARVMFHEVNVKAEGNASDLRALADEMDGLNADLAQMMADALGKPKETIITTYFDGKDHWLTTSEVIALGIAKPYGSTKLMADPITASIQGNDAIMAAYQAALPSDNQPITDTMKKVQFVAALLAANAKCGLTAESSEDAILAEVTAQANALTAANARIASLEAAEAAAKEARATELVDSAITANKIDKGQRDTYLKLAKADYESTSAVIAKLTPHTPISAQLNKDGKPAAEEFKGKSFKEISAAKGGPEYLAKLQKSDADLFNRMKASYNEVVE
jgi:ATP-dependent Clp protease protease subunit